MRVRGFIEQFNVHISHIIAGKRPLLYLLCSQQLMIYFIYKQKCTLRTKLNQNILSQIMKSVIRIQSIVDQGLWLRTPTVEASS